MMASGREKILVLDSTKFDQTAFSVAGNLRDVDIVVTDGFTGNNFLKAVEGLGKFVKRTLSESLKKNLISKIAALPSMPAIKRFAKSVDYKEYGGALFLGVKQPVVKAHGSSDAKVFEFTIKQAEQFVAEMQATDTLKQVDSILNNFSGGI